MLGAGSTRAHPARAGEAGALNNNLAIWHLTANNIDKDGPERLLPSPMRHLATCALSTLLIALCTAAPSSAQRGALAPLLGAAACVDDVGTSSTCSKGVGIGHAWAIVASPDGKHVYSLSSTARAIAAFARDRKSFALTQLPAPHACVSSATTVPEGCSAASNLLGIQGGVFRPDGKFLYVAASGDDAVVVLARDKKTGALTQVSCVSDTGAGGCADAPATFFNPSAVAVSKDGRHLYVASAGRTIGELGQLRVFAIDKRTGGLSALECHREGGGSGCVPALRLGTLADVALSPDGKNVYALSSFGPGLSALTAFLRNTKTGLLTQLPGTDACVAQSVTGTTSPMCATGVGMVSARSLTVSRDGKNIYLAANDSNGVAAFSRNPKTGAVRQLPGAAACLVTDDPSTTQGADACAKMPVEVSGGPRAVIVSPDGRSVYLAAQTSNAVVSLVRNTKTGELVQMPAPAACVTSSGAPGCTPGSITQPFDVIVTPDGKSVYVAGIGAAGANVGVLARARK